MEKKTTNEWHDMKSKRKMQWKEKFHFNFNDTITQLPSTSFYLIFFSFYAVLRRHVHVAFEIDLMRAAFPLLSSEQFRILADVRRCTRHTPTHSDRVRMEMKEDSGNFKQKCTQSKLKATILMAPNASAESRPRSEPMQSVNKIIQ